LLLFHPATPLPSYEVATIKPIDADAASRMVRLPSATSLNPLSIRRYIMDAYGAIYTAQVVGGPDWLTKDAYDIHGKVPDDLAAALRNMPRQNRIDQDRGMQQSLLADRFHLKAHCETRILPVYALVPAKGGLKIRPVPAPPEHRPGDPSLPMGPDDPLSPGSSRIRFNSLGLHVLNARAIKMELLARIIATDAGDRPIVNHTGFTCTFDITDLTWAPLGNATANDVPDASSLTVALEKTIGLKLVPTKAPIEVLVIDHINRPSEN
jgi:bla regulator protein blaR1